jgi:D-alanine-D-alanine ligase
LSENREVVILCGAESSERDVSIRSGLHAKELLDGKIDVRLVTLDRNELPDHLNPSRAIIFPLVHGAFGEDGKLQKLLDDEGFVYVGSGADSMEITINKARAKDLVAAVAVPTLPHHLFNWTRKNELPFDELCRCMGCGGKLFLKPNCGGSSINCAPCCDGAQWSMALDTKVLCGDWLAEPYCLGCKDITVAILHGHAIAVMEVSHGCNFFDYDAKYSAGAAKHICPAQVGEDVIEQLRSYSERAFSVCKCRDWARVDFIVGADGVFFLEVNAIPGFTKTSLYPDCAIGAGMSPTQCLMKLLEPALERHRKRYP